MNIRLFINFLDLGMEIISGKFWNCEKNEISVKKRWKSAKKNQKVSGPGLYKRILLVQKQQNI